ncbi:hypothetical protein A45J_0823 [hot springs metagenome]|uniref:Uncharacterized protein n=1 Tax=hot springs metagenome TaxID=433727 RepID=A0A5J4L2K9_9ZZZZ
MSKDFEQCLSSNNLPLIKALRAYLNNIPKICDFWGQQLFMIMD